MGQIIEEEIQLNREDEIYEEYLKEARARINPSSIAEDTDGLLDWFFLCLHADCRNHDFANADRKAELKLAAEAEVICEILRARELYSSRNLLKGA